MTELDMDEVGAFADQVAGHVTGAVTTAMVVLGDELGLYGALAAGPLTPAALADATGTHERYVREWLAQQAAVAVVEYDAESETFRLPPEHAAVLATDESPVAMAGAALLPVAMMRGMDRMVRAFRTGEGVAWGAQDAAAFAGTERFFRVGYRNSLVSEWIPAVRGAAAALTAGAHVADVGTGHGAALILLAQAFPESRFVGYDTHEPSLEVARKRAGEAGVADRVRFELAGAQDYPAEDYDLVCFFDVLHDLGDPVAAAVHARRALAADGAVLLVEPRAEGELARNLSANPFAGLNYAASTFLCVPNALSEPVGLALGGQAGEPRLTAALTEAGFSRVRRVAETPFTMVLEARP